MNTVTEHDTQCGEEHFSNFYVEHNLDLMLTGFGIYNFGNIGEKKKNSLDPDLALSLWMRARIALVRCHSQVALSTANINKERSKWKIME